MFRLLGQSGNDWEQQPAVKRSRRIYDDAVGEALIVVWEAADRICGKRLKAALPHLVESMERHGHLDLDPRVRQRLRRPAPPPWTDCSSPSGHRRPAASDEGGSSRWAAIYRCGPSPTGISPHLVSWKLIWWPIAGTTWADPSSIAWWATDVCTGWTEAVPLLAREQSLVVAGLEAIGRQLPFPVKGIDSDNDGAFINETLIQYCTDHGIEFTRSRAYRSNDQAWIEQKNGSVVRRFVGHDRYSGQAAGQTMAHLYEALRRYVNFYQPSFKLIDKTRDGATTVKHYSQPTTP